MRFQSNYLKKTTNDMKVLWYSTIMTIMRDKRGNKFHSDLNDHTVRSQISKK